MRVHVLSITVTLKFLCLWMLSWAGDMQSVHYHKRGAKITIAYEGDDCAGKKDEVEQAANKICADNTAMASVN